MVPPDPKSPLGDTESVWTLVHRFCVLFSLFCLAYLVLFPLRILLRLVELTGVLIVVLRAGLIAGGIYGLHQSGWRSIPMWGLLAIGIALPWLYCKFQLDSERLWWRRVFELSGRWIDERQEPHDEEAKR